MFHGPCGKDAKKRDAIELKNLLIANDNLITGCLSQEVFCVATKSELNVARFTEMHVANTTVEARCMELEAELALRLKYQNLKDIIGNNPPTPDKDTPDFDSVFVIGKMQASLQGKDNVIIQLKKKLSQLQVTRSDTDRTPKVQTTDSQITKLTGRVTHLQAQNDLFRAENDKIKQHYKELKATVNPQVSARDKHAIDVEPIIPCLRNNRDRHLDYLRHLKESVETIHDIIEEVKIVRPRDKSIVSACRVNSYPNASGSQPKSHVNSNRISPAKGVNKLPVEDQPRTNKSHLRTSNRTDSSRRLKRALDSGMITLVLSWDMEIMSLVTVSSTGYYVEGLRHNLFSVKQFCESDMEVAFRKHSCYVRDTDGVELIKGSCGSNLYTISIEDMMKSSPICLLSKAFKNKSWLWHRRLNHLNFGTISDLARKDLV
nr:integrase, catalytic region, zinc finger, CCHC-type, peptidase aspartic, catalytic [Tanacetum cinerariifolium]